MRELIFPHTYIISGAIQQMNFAFHGCTRSCVPGIAGPLPEFVTVNQHHGTWIPGWPYSATIVLTPLIWYPEMPSHKQAKVLSAHACFLHQKPSTGSTAAGAKVGISLDIKALTIHIISER